jgi:hypothetical protein
LDDPNGRIGKYARAENSEGITFVPYRSVKVSNFHP